ncbi:hypothetical protein C4J81_03595 [Deltaproteobacteria bacterium Smac51]|nr:hypothetical protein C4J81_03595 [Deltaproteobacteria bacterium Smac51]
MSAGGRSIGLISHLKIGTRLTVLVGAALLATVIVAATGMINNKRLADSVTFTYQAITRPLAAVANARGEFNAMRTALYDLAQDFNSGEQNSQFRLQLMRNLAGYEENILLYRSILSNYGTRDPYEAEAVDYLFSQLKPLRIYVESISSIGIKTGRGSDAVVLLRGNFLKAAEDISLDLSALTKILEAQTHEANLYADSLRRYNDILSFVITWLGAFVLLVIAWVIVKSITVPMKEMTTVAESLSQGRLDVHIGYHARNEIGILADSFRHLTQSVIHIINDMQNMAEKQSGGDIEYFIDDTPYKGSYKNMADGINTMMRTSIDDIKKIILYLSALARGDFQVRLERFPGKKAVISDSMDEIYTNLRSVHSEIDSLLKNAVNGQLGARVELDKYTGDWSQLMVELNNLLNAIIVPINEATEVLREISKGNFDARVVGDYKGDIARIKKAVNATAEGLSAYLSDKLAAERSAHDAKLARGRAEAATEAILSSIHYASKIQKNLRPVDDAFVAAFEDHSIIWEPRDIVGGDIYWMKSYEEGTILCVCDCTGHGTPGALLTMLVVSALEASVNERNYTDTAQIMWRLDQRLANILNVNPVPPEGGRGGILEFNDGCDIAIVFIANDGSLTISSANIHVFICDGLEVTQVRGQRLRIGEGGLTGPDRVKAVNIEPNPDNKFYIASDGLYDQIGGPMARPFGYKAFKNLILAGHHERQSVISEKIWRAFEDYRGSQARRDDVELITFKPWTDGWS